MGNRNPRPPSHRRKAHTKPHEVSHAPQTPPQGTLSTLQLLREYAEKRGFPLPPGLKTQSPPAPRGGAGKATTLSSPKTQSLSLISPRPPSLKNQSLPLIQPTTKPTTPQQSPGTTQQQSPGAQSLTPNPSPIARATHARDPIPQTQSSLV